MKRVLTSLIALILLLVGGSVANAAVGDVVTTLAGLSNSKVYTITAPRGALVLNAAGTNVCCGTKGTPSTEAGADQWGVISYKGGWLLYNVAKGQFFNPEGSFTEAPTVTNVVKLQLANNPKENYVFKFTQGTNTLNNNNAGGFNFDSWSTEDDGNRLTIVEAGDLDAAVAASVNIPTITWNVVDDANNVVATETIFSDEGVEYTTSLANGFPGVTLDTPTATGTTEDQVITTPYTFDYSVVPFKYSSSVDDATWYFMDVRGGKYCTYLPDSKQIQNVRHDNTADLNENNLFAYVGGPFGFTLYNYGAGTDAPFTIDGKGNGQRLYASTDATPAELKYEYWDNAGGYGKQNHIFRLTEDEKSGFNDNGGYLAIWYAENNHWDAGSNIAFTEVGAIHTYAELQDIMAQFDGLVAGTNPGTYTEASLTPLQNAISDVTALGLTEESSVIAISEAYNNIAAAAEALVMNEITEGYYTIFNDNAKIAANGMDPKAMYIDNTNMDLYWGAYDANSLKYVFKLTSDGNGSWYMQSAENGLYTGGAPGFTKRFHSTQTPTYAATFNFYPGTGSAYIKANNWTMCPQGNPNGDKPGPSYVHSYNGETITNAPFLEWTWSLTPVADEVVDDMQAVALAGVVATLPEAINGSNDPGTFTTAAAEAYAAALATAKTAAESGTAAEKAAAYKALTASVANLEINEITEGYYFIATAGNGPGYSGGPYNYEDKSALYNEGEVVKWKAYSKDDKTEVYKFTANADGNWDVFNVSDKTYINTGTAAYGQQVSTSAEPTTSQKFVAVGQGTGKFAIYSQTYAYAMKGNHNGTDAETGDLSIWGTTNEAAQYGVNVWYLHKITEEEYNELFPSAQQKVNELAAAIEELKTPLDAENYKTNLQGTERGGVISAPEKAKLEEAVAAAKAVVDSDAATDEEKEAAYEDLKAAYDACPVDNPIVDGYYYIYAAFDGLLLSYRTVDDADYAYKANWSDPATSLDMGCVFEVKKTGENAFTVQNVKTGKYLGEYNTVHNPSDKGSFALQADPFTTYIVPWRASHNYIEANKSYGEVTDAIDFCLFSESTFEHEYSGRWIGSGWNIHSDLGDYVAHAWRLLPVDEAYNAYMAEKDFNDLMAAADEALAVPTPANHHDNDPARDRSFLLGNEKLSVDGLATSKEAHDALQAARDAVYEGYKTDGKSLDELATEVAALNSAMEVVNAKSNPLVDGYYYLVAEYDGGTDGIPGGFVIEATETGIAKVAFDETEPKQMFKVEYDAENGKVYLQNVANEKYLGVVEDNAWTLSDDKVALNIMSGKDHYWYHSAEKTVAARSCSFVLYDDDNNGIYSPNCNIASNASLTTSYGWFVSWAFRPADEAYEQYKEEEEAKSAANYWEVATEPTAPVSGKTYVIKNAVNDLYLIAGTGVAAEYNPLKNTAIWQFDETETEVDGNKTWTLKSIEEDGYWKYINYDEKSGYDGYDWFGYAGMNAEFSTLEDAELFTILTPEQSATKTRNSVKNDQAVVDGAYVITAKEQIGGNWFKLDTQRGTDAALEPWQDAPQWLFYEATQGDDINRELEIALEVYNVNTEDFVTGTDPGYYNADNVAAYNEARAAAEALATGGGDVKQVSDIEEGAYYNIVSDRKKFSGNTSTLPKAMSTLQDSYPIKWGDIYVYWGDMADASADAYQWKAVQSGSGWAFQNKENGKYLGGKNTGENDVIFSDSPVAYTLADIEDGAGKFYMICDGEEHSLTVQGYGIARADNSLAIQREGDDDYDDEAAVNGYPGRWHFVPVLSDGEQKVAIRKAIDALAEAYETAATVNPIVEGYYAIVSAGKGPGYYTGDAPSTVIDEEEMFALYNDGGLVKWKYYDDAAYDQIYYFTEDENGNWYAQNFYDGTFINKGAGSYSTTISTSPEATTAQIFEPAGVAGKFTFKFDGNPYVYALTNSHNGSKEGVSGTLNIWGSSAEAQKFGMNVWFLRSVSDDQVEAAKEAIASQLSDLIAQYEDEDIQGSDAPGYYSNENVDAFNTALSDAKDAAEGTIEQKMTAISNLKTAYAKVTSELNPVTEGYYYLVNKSAGYVENFGVPAAMYTAPESKQASGAAQVRFEKFDENNAHFIFKLTAKEGVDNAFYAQNAADDWYLNTGDGDSWYGEVTTASEEAANAQIFQNYGYGQFFVSDETDGRVSRVIRKASGVFSVQNGTVYGWSTTSDNIAEADKWYNAWELIPVTEEKANELVTATKAADEAADAAANELATALTESEAAYNSYVADDSPVSEETKQALTEAYEAAQAAVKAMPYDITTTADAYNDIKEALEDALAKAQEEMPAVIDYWQIADEPSMDFEPGKT
ncbi:MAG: hypothetical protein Q4E49_01960, partial [Bacteroidales bacterium]|nr:hypothetical protein [Bacteroidales bacterium]